MCIEVKMVKWVIERLRVGRDSKRASQHYGGSCFSASKNYEKMLNALLLNHCHAMSPLSSVIQTPTLDAIPLSFYHTRANKLIPSPKHSSLLHNTGSYLVHPS
jgi:hypothetical protein